MIKYYFIGNKTRGPKLIKALEEKGGINFYTFSARFYRAKNTNKRTATRNLIRS